MRNQVFVDIFCSLVSLCVLIVAIYSISRGAFFSLPVPTVASCLSIIIPLVTYPTIRLLGLNTPSSPKSRLLGYLARLVPPTLLAINIILLTLATNNLVSPSVQACILRDRLLNLFRTKNVKAIRRIQDAMECCGFRSNHDMAWPFKDKDHGDTACEIAFGRTTACENAWAGERQRIMAFMVVIGGIGLIVVISTLTDVRQYWFRNFTPETTHRQLHRQLPSSDAAEYSQDRLLGRGEENVESDLNEQYTDDPQGSERVDRLRSPATSV